MNKQESNDVIRFKLDFRKYLAAAEYCRKNRLCFKDFVSHAIDEFTRGKAGRKVK
ncbi:hypothetical protein [uncultured Anaerofustis sp.]|uniref:hypothetical protein n=1 Tax=uncultured Anaerofustis sp. TaxID=904996 RepID=UPI0025D95CB6|nr:hypothetical protein [uncultured Anaerofustis sp.]